MSRKTAVCVLFVVFVALAGTPSLAQPAGWDTSGAAAADSGSLTRVALPHHETGDPDGLEAAGPGDPAGWLLELVRLFLGSLTL